ncbi:MAG: SET domain-containing protein-lysine N-methyltransferase [Proteobacteria bacterium]|nr:SET domain-containing protein-lysine N-methyltransferase [Pseudomonadota bacterium]
MKRAHKEKKGKQSEHLKTIKKLGIQYMEATDYISSEADQIDLVEVKPLSLLSGGQGLFSKSKIPAQTTIGSYTGEIFFSFEEYADFLKTNPKANPNYSMATPSGQVIDAANKGNFTRFANHSDIQANCLFVPQPNGEMHVITARTIKPGEQLLIDYGTYNEDDAKNLLFLNPSDNELSPEDLITQYSYHRYLLKKTLSFYNLPEQPEEQVIYCTDIGLTILKGKSLEKSSYNKEEINLPFLLEKSPKNFFSFCDIDHLFPLILAIHLGQLNNVKWLVKNGANVNQQAHHSGYSPLIAALQTYQTAGKLRSHRISKEHALEIICLLAQKANPLTYDQDDFFLHQAIDVLDVDAFKALFIALKKNTKWYKLGKLFSVLNSDNLDPMLYAVSQEQWEKAEVMLALSPTYHNKFFKKDDKQQLKKLALERSDEEHSFFCQKAKELGFRF